MKRSKFKATIGIDEAGRGPLAGPVAVGVSMVPVDFDWKLLAGVGDSKKVSSKNRLAIFKAAQALKRKGLLNFKVALVSSQIIDRIGIVPAIRRALERGLISVMKQGNLHDSEVVIKLDGGLKAPKEYLQQETIIRGDSKELVIGLASILAKVTRDKYMERLALKPDFEAYGFSVHKGYGTKKHREAIVKSGLSSEHRKSFCGSLVLKAKRPKVVDK